MRILIFGINYAPELTGIGKYTGEMAGHYASLGHEVEVITAPPYYPYWSVQPPYANTWRTEYREGVKVRRCPLYVPHTPSGIKRILHEFTFLCSSLVYWVPAYFRRYDMILCVSPPFHLPLLALPHKWLRGTPIVNHVQDLQVDAAGSTGLLKNGTLLKVLASVEKFILNRVTAVATISAGMAKRLRAKLVKDTPILNLPNWVDKNKVYPVAKSQSLREEWNFKDTDKVVLYSGNLGVKQGLDSILRVAAKLRKNEDINFVIVGDGGTKELLIALSERLGLTNVRFLPLQPLEKLPQMLAAADVHLVLQTKAAEDLVLPSKLTNILAVGGHALVTADPGTTLHEIVNDHHLGTLSPAEDENSLEENILAILNGRRGQDARGALAYSGTHLNKVAILNDFLDQIKPLVQPKQ